MKSAEAFIELLEQGFTPAKALEYLPNYNPFNIDRFPLCSFVSDARSIAVPEQASHD